MCNAHGHSPGCGCGFGPPYGTSGAVGSAREWAQDIIHEPPLARDGLQEAGWPERSIEDFLAEYSRLLETGLPEETLVIRINRLLGRHRLVEKRVIHERLQVPLFRFSAPQAPGASVSYSEAYGTKKTGWWRARVYGIGTGGSQAVAFSTEQTYSATNGQCKLIYVPVPLRIAEVDVLQDGQKVGEGLRAQVNLTGKKRRTWSTGRGLRVLRRGDCGCPEGQVAEEEFNYQLSQDEGANTRARHSWGVNIENEVFLSLSKVFGAEVRVRVGRDKAMTVQLDLPPGFDYAGGKGAGRLWWTAP